MTVGGGTPLERDRVLLGEGGKGAELHWGGTEGVVLLGRDSRRWDSIGEGQGSIGS